MTRSPRRLPVVPLTWRVPLTAVLLVLAVVALIGIAIVATPVSGPEPIDYSTFAPPGSAILRGDWIGIFSNPIIQAGPIELIFWGVPSLIGVHGVVGWVVFGIVVGSLFTIALAALAERLLRPMIPHWSVPIGVGIAATAALTGLITTPTSSGHPSEIAVPMIWLICAVLARRGHPVWAAALLASTAGWELWGLLAIPVLLLTPRITVRVVLASALGGGIVLALLFLPFALLGPFHMFAFSWPVYENTLAHLLFPQATTFAWPLRLAQGVLALGAGTWVALLLRRNVDAIWLVPLVVCVVRLFTDPVLAGYYEVPPLIMLLVGAGFAVAQRSPVTFVLALVIVNVMVDVRLTVVSAGTVVVLTAVLAIVVVRRARRTDPLVPITAVG